MKTYFPGDRNDHLKIWTVSQPIPHGVKDGRRARPDTLKMKRMRLLCEAAESKLRVTSSTCQQGLAAVWVAAEAAGSRSSRWIGSSWFTVWGWEADEPLGGGGGGGCAWVGGCGGLMRGGAWAGDYVCVCVCVKMCQCWKHFTGTHLHNVKWISL